MVATTADQCDTSDKYFQRRGEIAALRHVLACREQAEAALKALPDREFDDEPKREVPQNDLEQ